MEFFSTRNKVISINPNGLRSTTLIMKMGNVIEIVVEMS